LIILLNKDGLNCKENSLYKG